MLFRSNASTTVWPNRESLLACVKPDQSGEKVIRNCARLAAQLGVPWHAIFVEVPSESSDDSTLYDRAARVLKLAANLGATIATQSATDVASALIRYARDHNLSRLVLGRSKKRWFFPWKKTIAQKIGQTADDLDIQIGRAHV